MEEKSKFIISIEDISSKYIYINKALVKLNIKFIISIKLILYFLFIFFISFILEKCFINRNKKINIITIKNNTFINEYDNEDNNYMKTNEIINNKYTNYQLNNRINLTMKYNIYNIFFNKNIINNNFYFLNNSETKNYNENSNSVMSNKMEEESKTNENYIYNIILNEINKYRNHEFNISFDKKEDFYERINPKISIIITIFNQNSFINTIYACIQSQSLKDIEIIFVDDASIDNSSCVIYNLMKEDKRIVYIKNSVNKGQFYSRYKGVKMARGEYILVIDPDDLLLNDILINAYEFANYFDLDIVHYYHIKGKYNENVVRKMNISGIYYHPQIKEIFFNCSYRYLWDKLIKKKVFIKSIEFIKEKYRNTRIIIHNDEVACFGVFRVAKSYGILKQIGYFYNRDNPKSITKYNFKVNNINGRFHTLFTIMEFYYEQSDNNTYDKTMGGYNFFDLRINYIYKDKIKYLTNEFQYINNILDLYINSPYYNQIQKNNLKSFKIKINEQKIKINKQFV